MAFMAARLRANPKAVALGGTVAILAAASASWYLSARGGTDTVVTSLRDGERFVFVSARDAAEVAVVDGKLDRVAARVSMPAVPKHLLVSEPTGTLVASVAGSSVLDIVELAPATGRARIDLGIEADNLVLSPDGYLVAAHNASAGLLAVASLQTRKRLFQIDEFAGSHHLTFGYDGSQIYVVNASTAELAVVDLVQQQVIERIKLNGSSISAVARHKASALTCTPDGRHGFIAMTTADSVIAVDLSSMKVVRQIRVGSRPSRPYATADGRVVLVGNDGDRTVSVIDSTTLQVVATLPGVADVIAINTGWFESFAFVMSGSEKRIAVRS